MLFIILAMLGIGIIAYAVLDYDELGQAVALGIIIAAVVTVIWDTCYVIRFARVNELKANLIRIIIPVTLVAMIGSAAIAYTVAGPLSSDEDGADGFVPGTPTPTLVPTPTMKPPPVYQTDIGRTRQDGGLLVTLNGACFEPEDSLAVEITIENTGNSSLSSVDLQMVPKTVSIDNPFSDPAHPCHGGIVPGQKCYSGNLTDTSIRYSVHYLYRETYLVVSAEDSAGGTYGVTFEIPSASMLPECQ
jgi:hypothetical protein